MADEEGNRRFENALATLSELAANQDGRMARLEALAADHQRLFVNHERRISGLEEAFRMLVEMSRRHDERADEIRAAQAETEHKLAALVDAQVRTQEAAAESERKLAALAEAQLQTEQAMKRSADAQERLADAQERLADAQAHSDRRLDALIDVVNNLLNGRGPGGGTADSG